MEGGKEVDRVGLGGRDRVGDMEGRMDTPMFETWLCPLLCMYTRCREALNGDETVIVEEDGIITSKTHNGRPCVTVTSV